MKKMTIEERITAMKEQMAFLEVVNEVISSVKSQQRWYMERTENEDGDYIYNPPSEEDEYNHPQYKAYQRLIEYLNDIE